MADELKTIKFQMMLSESEAQAIDDWSFENRIRSRAEAIRRLCQVGIFISPVLEEMLSEASDLLQFLGETLTEEQTDQLVRKHGKLFRDILLLGESFRSIQSRKDLNQKLRRLATHHKLVDEVLGNAFSRDPTEISKQ